MTDRLDSLPVNQVPAFLDRLEQDLADLRATHQRVGGASVRTIQTSSANAYDWSGVLPPDPQAGSPFGLRLLRVTATATTMDNLFGDLIVQMYVGSPTNWYRPNQFRADILGGGDAWAAEVFQDSLVVSDTSSKHWQINVSGNDTTPVYLKFTVIASDAVTITTSVLS